MIGISKLGLLEQSIIKKLSHILRFGMIAKLLRNEITEERTYFTLTLLTGFLGGLVAVFINKSVHYLSHTFHTDNSASLYPPCISCV